MKMRVNQPTKRHEWSGLRPLDPSRDFSQLADVIEVAFAEEMSPGAEVVMRDLRMMARMRPVFWLFSHITPSTMADSFGGYVWEEDGQVVGNTTLTRLDEMGSQWIISNVAVLPDYRRRGIAKALVVAAMQQARERGGQRVMLHVRSDNDAARLLYEALGFRFVESSTELFAPTIHRNELYAPEGVTVREPVVERWQEAYELARATIPSAVQMLRPLRPAAYRVREPSVGEKFRVALGLPHRERLWCELEGHVVALMTLDEQKSGRFGALVEVIQHPRVRGRVESVIVNEIGKRLGGSHDVRATIAASLTELRAALTHIGFYEIRTLDQMVAEL